MSRRLKETYHRLGELVVRRKAASHEVVDELLALQRSDLERGRRPRRLGELLIERKILDRLTIREILQEQQLHRGEKREFKIALKDEAGVAVLSLAGRLDRDKTPVLTKILERLMNRGFARVVIDASKLVHIESQGIAAFIPYVDESRARGGDVKFSGLGPQARVIIDRLGLDRFIQTFPAKATAIHAFDTPIDEYMSRGALGEYVSSPASRQFHLSYCSISQMIPEDDRLYYESKLAARHQGKQACKKCRP